MGKRTFHTRVVVVHYDSNDVRVFETETEEEGQKWYRALGRLVAYGLQGKDRDDSTQLMSLSLGNPEMTACYHNPLPVPRDRDGFEIYSGSPDQAVSVMWDRLRSEQPFVLGAVLHDDGEWGFHS